METTKKPVNGTETEGGICAVAVPAQAALDAVRLVARYPRAHGYIMTGEFGAAMEAVLAALENLDARLRKVERQAEAACPTIEMD